MKITLLPYQLGGTGGAIAATRIGNTLLRYGHDVRAYTEQMPDATMKSFIHYPVESIRDMPNHSPDVVICFNPGKKSKIYDAFLTLPGIKVWRLGLVNLQDYEEVMGMDDIIKICTTTNDKRFLDVHGVKNGHVILGPANPEDFFPYQGGYNFRSNNIIMSYLKKSGWTSVRAINLVQKQYPKMIFASLGTDIPGKDYMIESETPILFLGAPANFREYIRYSYNKAFIFVDTCSNGYWAWGGTLAEAMLCKCPVVATNSPEFDDIVIEGETALTAQHDEETELPPTCSQWQDWRTRPSPKRIAERVCELIENPGLRLRLTENAYNLVSQYNLDYWYNKFMELVG